MLINNSIQITICVGTYNRLNHLKLTIQNVINELSEIPFEIIIVDGGSTDGTVNYIKKLELSHNNIRHILHGKLLGMSNVFNDCFKISKGKYIFNLPDHSLIEGKMFLKSIALMEKQQNICGVAQKIYVNDSRYRYIRYHKKFPYIILLEQIIFKKHEIDYIDKNYQKHYWLMDIVLKCLLDGKIISCTKQFSEFHIQIINDDMHKYSNLNRSGSIDKKYFYNKWDKLINIMEKELSPHKKLINKFNKKILNIIYYCTNSGFMKKYIFKKTQILDDYNEILLCDSEFMTLIKPNFSIKFIDKVIDWLLDKTSAINSNDIDKDNNFYLFQKLPDRVINNYKN